MTLDIRTAEEYPVFLRSEPHDLFGMLTLPATRPRDTAVLLLWGSGAMPSFGPNRIRIRLARRLAGIGYHVLRVDYPGCGESTGDIAPVHDLGNPCTGDVLAAAHWLRAHGISQLVLVGTCFGARAALGAARHLTNLAAVCLVAPPVWDDDEQLMKDTVLYRKDPSREIEWASQRFLVALDELVERQVPSLMVYGTRDHVYDVFQRARIGRLGQLLRKAGDLATVEVCDGWIHSFPTLEGQETGLRITEEWLRTVVPATTTKEYSS